MLPKKQKKRRLAEIIEVQNRLSKESNLLDIGKIFEVLIEGESKKNNLDWKGRNSQNKVLIFPKENYLFKAGDYAMVKVTECTQGTLIGKIIPPIPEAELHEI